MSKGGWESMDTAPKDGSPVWVRCVHNGKLVTRYWAVWGIMAEDAAMRRWAAEGIADPDYADTPRWLTEDRLYAFPTPTAWHPERTQAGQHVAAA